MARDRQWTYARYARRDFSAFPGQLYVTGCRSSCPEFPVRRHSCSRGP